MKPRQEVYGFQHSNKYNFWGYTETNGPKCLCGWTIMDPDFWAGKCLHCNKEFK